MSTYRSLLRMMPLAMAFLVSCTQEEVEKPLDRSTDYTKSGKLTPNYLVNGDVACFDVMRACNWESATCNSTGEMLIQTPCTVGYVCAGGVAFLKGTGTNYGPWHIIQPRTRPNGFKCLRVRFKSTASQETVGHYNAVTGTWTVETGSNFQAQQVSPPADC
jgi:hypothetical protein